METGDIINRLPPEDRRRLTKMARERQLSADELALALLTEVGGAGAELLKGFASGWKRTN